MTSADCDGYGYLLYRNGVPLNVPHDDVAVGGVKFVTTMVTNVTKDFIGTNGDPNMIIVKQFTIPHSRSVIV